jgi:AmmeMemoRadiSam system protein A
MYDDVRGANMMPDTVNSGEKFLSEDERAYLLNLARQALRNAVNGEAPPLIQAESLTPNLREMGASFVTLTQKGMLRGCIGALEPYQGLAADVREHAAAAALEDYRFPPVQPDELPDIQIEISRLTVPQPLDYKDAQDLLRKLRPGCDGVVLRDGHRRATFLPQVWEKIPRPEDFLDQLCMKMGAGPDLWRRKKMTVLIYQVEEFQEG